MWREAGRNPTGEKKQEPKEKKTRVDLGDNPLDTNFSPALTSCVPWANDSSHLSLPFHDYRIGQQAEPGQAVIG